MFLEMHKYKKERGETRELAVFLRNKMRVLNQPTG